MSSTDLIDLFYPWTQSGQDAERKQAKTVEAAIDTIRERKNKLFNLIKKDVPSTNNVRTWMEEQSYQLSITGTLSTSTITFSGYLFKEAISADAMRQHIKGGTILERVSDGIQMRVSATAGDIDYDNLTAVVSAHGNSGSLSDDASAVEYAILGDSISDYDSTFVGRGIDRGFRYCGSQIFKENLEMPWTKLSIKMENIPSEWLHQLQELMKNFYNKIAMSAIRMRPMYSSGAYVYGNKTSTPTMTGVCQWPDLCYAEYPNANVYVNKSSAPIDPTDLNNLIDAMYYDEKADYDMGDWIIATHPVTASYISDFGATDRRFEMRDTKWGYRCTHFASKIGKDFPIISDDKIAKGSLVVVEPGSFEWCYLKDYGVISRKLPEDNSNVDKQKVTCQVVGTKCRSPRQKIGKIYGLPTTYV